jgi:hypothetical protein
LHKCGALGKRMILKKRISMDVTPKTLRPPKRESLTVTEFTRRIRPELLVAVAGRVRRAKDSRVVGVEECITRPA